MKLRLHASWLLIGILWLPSAQAEEASGWHFGGFLTLGATLSDDSDLRFSRDLSEPGAPNDLSLTPDTRLGLQAAYHFNPQWSAVGQIVSQYKYNRTYAPELTWGFLSYQPTPQSDIRVGRLGFDVFLGADSRNVGYSYLWARPLSDYYGLLIFSYFDGVDYSYLLPVGEDHLKLKVYAGSTDQHFPTGSDAREHAEFDHSPLYGAIAEYIALNWQLRLSYANFKSKARVGVLSPLLSTLRNSMVEQAVSLAGELDFYNAGFQYLSLGYAYDLRAWRFESGLSYTRSDVLTYPDNVAGYLSVGYRRDDWTPYVFWSFLRSDIETRTSGLGSTVDAQVEAVIEDGYSDQRTFGIGARFDLGENTAVKVQVEKLQSDIGNGLTLWQVQDDWDGDTTLYSLTLEQVF